MASLAIGIIRSIVALRSGRRRVRSRSAKYRHQTIPIRKQLDRTKLVVFIATPHTGSDKVTLLERFRLLIWGTDSVRDLVANAPELRHLNLAYRDLVKDRKGQLHHLVYYEMAGTLAGWIVRPDSSDPGLECRPTPIPEDHIAIAKPRRPDDLVYCEPKKLLSELAPEPAQPGELCENTLAPFETERSLKDFVPKIIRFVALGLLAFALWQGVSHLSILDRVILGSGDDASKATLQLEKMSKKLDAMSRQLAESLASRNNEPATKADIDRKAQELKPKISSAVKAASCAGKPNGAVCAVIPNVGTGYCSAGTCSNFTAQ